MTAVENRWSRRGRKGEAGKKIVGEAVGVLMKNGCGNLGQKDHHLHQRKKAYLDHLIERFLKYRQQQRHLHSCEIGGSEDAVAVEDHRRKVRSVSNSN